MCLSCLVILSACRIFPCRSSFCDKKKLQNVHFTCLFFRDKKILNFLVFSAYLWVSLIQSARWQRSTVDNYFIQCYWIYQGCCRHPCIYAISCSFPKKLKSWSFWRFLTCFQLKSSAILFHIKLQWDTSLPPSRVNFFLFDKQ